MTNSSRPEQDLFVPDAVRDRARFGEAVRRIDAENARDPRATESPAGPQPFELNYARRLTRWVRILAPNASEALALAARGQHIARWEIPRTDFPEGLKGYLHWRETLKQFHAEKLDVILRSCGYGDDVIVRVRGLVTKELFPENDPESQVIEDALCLVFLELQLADIVERHPREKVIDILRKTWAKMSEAGRAQARHLPMDPTSRELVKEATV